MISLFVSVVGKPNLYICDVFALMHKVSSVPDASKTIFLVFLTRQCKSTFCRHSKVIADEEEASSSSQQKMWGEL